jgi:hypothetical protein
MDDLNMPYPGRLLTAVTRKQEFLNDARILAWKVLHSPVVQPFYRSVRERHANDFRRLWTLAKSAGWQFEFEAGVTAEVEAWMGTQLKVVA